MHGRLPLLGYTHVAQHYNDEEVCPLCVSDRENELHLFPECDITDHLWETVEDVAIGMGRPLPSGPQSRVTGAIPSAALCQ